MVIGHFRVPPGLFQNEGRCSAFDMEIVFHSHANKAHFHKKGCAPGARFSKVPIINGPGKPCPFILKIEVSKVLHLA